MRLMSTLRGMSRGDLRTSTGSPDALDINHTDRLRGRLSGKRHVAANVAVIVRSAHAERTGYDWPPDGRLFSSGVCDDDGEKGNGEDRAHARKRHSRSELRKNVEITIS